MPIDLPSPMCHTIRVVKGEPLMNTVLRPVCDCLTKQVRYVNTKTGTVLTAADWASLARQGLM